MEISPKWAGRSLLDSNRVDESWRDILLLALQHVDNIYLRRLAKDGDWLPGVKNIFNAFMIPVSDVRFILVGESPYPRAQSANGFAFWDGAVEELWAEKGMSKKVNRATSLRNIMKMLLVAEHLIDKSDTSQNAIARVDKSELVKSAADLFNNFIKKGFLLLNASLVLSRERVNKDAEFWNPFINSLLHQLAERKTENIILLLFGNIAKEINALPASASFKQLCAEHPYNLSFINNNEVVEFFSGQKLLYLSS